MISIVIREGSSERTLEQFKKVIETMVPEERIKKVKIFYEKSKGLPAYDCSIEKYPVIFYTDMNVSIHLYSLSAGYNGTGPNHLMKILKLAGFGCIHEHYITGGHEVVDITQDK